MVLKRGDRGEEVKTLQRKLNLYADGIFGIITEEAVKAFQRKNGLKVDGIVGAMTWAALPKNEEYSHSNLALKKSRRTIKEIIVHCTATPEGQNKTVEQIRKEHKQQGWSDIGYHFLVYLDGSIYLGRDVDLIGAHCSKGGHNTYSIGVSYVGGVEFKPGVPYKHLKPKDTRTPEQKESLLYLLKELKKLYPNAQIYGHHDFDKGKACPSFDARKEYCDL